jgi:hypothetical protein
VALVVFEIIVEDVAEVGDAFCVGAGVTVVVGAVVSGVLEFDVPHAEPSARYVSVTLPRTMPVSLRNSRLDIVFPVSPFAFPDILPLLPMPCYFLLDPPKK